MGGEREKLVYRELTTEIGWLRSADARVRALPLFLFTSAGWRGKKRGALDDTLLTSPQPVSPSCIHSLYTKSLSSPQPRFFYVLELSMQKHSTIINLHGPHHSRIDLTMFTLCMWKGFVWTMYKHSLNMQWHKRKSTWRWCVVL